MYGTPNSSTYEEEHANTNNSTIKTVIDNWYKNNLADYTSKLEDTVWCNDRSIDTVSGYGTGLGYGTNRTAYNVWYRLEKNKSPSLSCTNVNDRFTVSTSNGNGALTYPVALLTADEIVYAGGVYNTNNKTCYLYTNKDWHSLSPAVFNGYNSIEWYVDSDGYPYSYFPVYNSFGVRPAVSLSSSTFIFSGDGTSNSPYIVE
jgi:hypothetical protein